MTECIEKVFDNGWQAAKFVEEGGQLLRKFNKNEFVHIDCPIEAVNLFFECVRLYTFKATDWKEKLDGTIENGVLCWLSDSCEQPSIADHCSVEIVVGFDDDRKRMDVDNCWDYATPLTKAEIKKLMENAPE